MASTPGAAGGSEFNDNDSFSSDSDDEFLTMRRNAGASATDREAMIRKKLLESFYGKSAVGNEEPRRAAGTGNDSDSRDSSDDDNDDGTDPLRAEDLDSPQFNAVAHTQKHVFSSGVHPLLETEESLACQVRTLDSSLQTLVYENYSRFIDATDAIRSIGVNVQANHANLSQLQQSMSVVAEASRSVETVVGPLRDQVVEKLRVKRLLQRLDTLLKLPTTLRQQIQAGKYRLATQSYVSAYSILSKHSAGFESLQRIEADCHEIMTQLLQDVKLKLIHWSGGVVPSMQRIESGGKSEKDSDSDSDEEGNRESVAMDEDDGPVPDPPQSIVEIMECAGTPVLILAQQSAASKRLDPGLTTDDCQEMALNASLRFLERVLDAHHIELQEQHIVSTMKQSTQQRGAFADPLALGDEGANAVSSSSLVPTTVLDSALEVSTLYTVIFFTNEDDKVPDGPDERLTQFILSAFGNFLQHVRGELLEQAMLQQQRTSQTRVAPNMGESKNLKNHKKTPSEDAADDEEMLRRVAAEAQADEESDQIDEKIATAMATLLLSVRRLASGLDMVPRMAVAPELASSLVDQTLGLTEAMVRRRVDQKFYALRLRVIEDCLAPFCQALIDLSHADEVAKEEQPPPLLGAVQLASVALSDSLQLVDDTVRSILAILEEDEEVHEIADDYNENRSTNDSMLRQAVEHSTKRFAKWLASAMETLAGYESPNDPKLLLQTTAMQHEGGKIGIDEILHRAPSFDVALTAVNKAGHISDDSSEMSVEPSDGLVERALLDLSTSLEPTVDVVLAIAEMCRVAERSVMENIHQSISTHGSRGSSTGNGIGSGGANKRKIATGTMGDGLFSGDENQKSSRATTNPVSQRFRMAASRVLSLFAMNRGHEAANLLCATLPQLSYNSKGANDFVEGPRPSVCQVLELAKATSEDCADLFGGSRRAGPIPDALDDEYVSFSSSRRNGSANNRSGLVFDVERMFVEKVLVFPHPNDVSDFQRNAVLAMVFKVAFKALAESARILLFSVQGYRQLKVDVEFLKWYLPHYIKDEALFDGSNARTALSSLLTEVVQSAKDRCVLEQGDGLYEDVEETNQARATIRHYMASQQCDGDPSFCISTD